jgi:hypothetical protein
MPLIFSSLYEAHMDRGEWARRARQIFLGTLFPLLALIAYFHSIYGVWTPLGAHHEPFNSLFRLKHFWDGFFGLLFDQECGLWFHFPVFALTVAGGFLMAHSRNPLRGMVLGTLVFFYLFMSFYENLGLTPATRYIVGVTPLLMLTLYPVFESLNGKGGWARLGFLTFGIGVSINWLLAAVPWMRYNKLDGVNFILKIASGFIHLPLNEFEPAFQAPVVEWKSYLLSGFWLMTVMVLSALFIRLHKTSGKG